jgi:hypothetical protein
MNFIITHPIAEQGNFAELLRRSGIFADHHQTLIRPATRGQ